MSQKSREQLELERWRRLTALSDLQSIVEEFYVLFGVDEQVDTQANVPRHKKSTTDVVDWD